MKIRQLAPLAPAFLLATAALACAQNSAPPATAYSVAAIPSFGKILTYFLVMLGPMKLLGPFARLTAGMELAQARKLAGRAALLAVLGGLACVTLGRDTLDKWSISLPALLLAAGLVLLLVALRDVLSQFSVTDAGSRSGVAAADQSPNLAFSPIAFPYILPPYGAAALILLTAAASNLGEILMILLIFIVVIALDFLAMWFVRPVLKYAAGPLGLLGAVLGVLQVALALQMLIAACRQLHIIT